MKVRYRRIKNGDGSVVDKIERLPQGDWVDLRTKERISVLQGEYHQITLGIAMELLLALRLSCCREAAHIENTGFCSPTVKG